MLAENDTYLVHNMSALTRRHPILARKLTDLRPSLNWNIHAADDGLKTVERFIGERHSRFIHSRVSPMKEAQQWADNAQSSSDTLVVLGVGLGYHIVTLQEIHSPGALIIIDADLDLFRFAVKLTDLTPVIRDPKVHLLIGKTVSEVSNCLSRFSESAVSYREYLPATGLHPEYYQSIKDILEGLICKYRLMKDPVLSQGVMGLLDETKR